MTLPHDQILAELGGRADEFFTRCDEFANVTALDAAAVFAPDVVSLGWLLARIRKAVKELQLAANEVEDEMTRSMPGKTVEIPGVGTAEMHAGAKRSKWDPEIRTPIAHSIAAEMPTLIDANGEPVNNIGLVRDVLGSYDVVHTSSSYKVTGLRAWGIDPGDWCETVWGRKTIQMPALPMQGETTTEDGEDE